jgi:hypothetical protein
MTHGFPAPLLSNAEVRRRTAEIMDRHARKVADGTAAPIDQERAEVGRLRREVARLTAALEELTGDSETRHIIDIRVDSWTLKHPVSCRPDLFNCPVNRAAEETLVSRRRHAPGKYECFLIEDGQFVVGLPVSTSDGAS